MNKTTWVLRLNTSDREAYKYSGATFDCPAEEGMALVANGTACFAVAPILPPFELLDLLQDQLTAKFDVLGPSLEDRRHAPRLQKTLFPGGVRQSHVDGHPVRWEAGIIGLRWLVGDALSPNTNPRCNLFAEARWLAAGHGITNGIDGPEGESVYSRMIRLSTWDIDMPRHHASHNTYSEAWDRFTEALLALQPKFDAFVCAALSERRVVVSKEAMPGSSFVVPDIARDLVFSEAGSEYCFALSRDLPKTWLAEIRPTNARKLEAVRWLERAEAFFAPRRFSIAQSEEAAMQRFDLSQSAAKDAVNHARSGGQRKGGAIPESQKIKDDELLGYN